MVPTENAAKITLPMLPKWGCSSAGRARRSQRRGHRFDPGQLHQYCAAFRCCRSKCRPAPAMPGELRPPRNSLRQLCSGQKGSTTTPDRETASNSRFRQSVVVFKANYRTNIRANSGARNATNRPACPYCHGSEVYVSSAKTFWERLSALLLLRRVRSDECGGGIFGQCSCPLLHGLRDEGFHGRPK